MKYPKKVQIEATNYCNLQCKGCLREKMKRKKGFITTNTFLNALDLCADFGIEEIHLHHWGEPLLHPKIVNLVEISSILGFKVGFTTNATILNSGKLKNLFKVGLNKIDISYNCNGVNKEHLKDLYSVSNKLGIETWFRSVIYSKEQYNKLKEELIGYRTKFQRGMIFDEGKEREKICKAINVIFIINWDGIITPCCSMYDNQYTYGKVGNITVDKLKNEIKKLGKKIRNKEVNCCNHCFEIEDDLQLDFKL